MAILCLLRAAIRKLAVKQGFGGLSKVVHSKVDSLRFSSRDIEIPWRCSTAAENNSIIFRKKLLRVEIDADLRICDKLHMLSLHPFDTALHDAFIELHVRNTVHQQAAEAVTALKDRYFMPAAV